MNDITLNPERTDRGSQVLQREELVMDRPAEKQQQAVQFQTANGVQCPYCGTINEPDAMFCASCGQPLGKMSCPNCGAEIDPDADFCEVCHHYIRTDICSFCGARLSGQEAFCPECGSPRGGIVCPVCHTLNDFSFCKQCGTALTEEARQLLAELQMTPEYKEMQALAKELEELDMSLPYSSEKDLVRDQINRQLRERVLKLLAQDKGSTTPVVEKPSKRVSKEELDAKKKVRADRLTELLEKMAQAPQPQPAKVRNYAMACKPQGVRLAWECNFKHALHSSPCGCAKPQMGGKWIILGKNSKQEIKDDI
ncbi:MAG: zinc ribbon domain-containing protein [Prevotella sp.]|nr:zinc ribbon domain-containing protein [Prevotella sp.]MBO7129216.1 zinc ribbon domain-containing protein [Prevotella sp.]